MYGKMFRQKCCIKGLMTRQKNQHKFQPPTNNFMLFVKGKAARRLVNIRSSATPAAARLISQGGADWGLLGSRPPIYRTTK